MIRRLPALMQVFPQIDPWNVWDLPVNLWRAMARMTDEWIDEQWKAASRG